jgi:hypothetical protein
MTYARTAAWLAGALLSSSILATAQLPPSVTEFPTPASDSYPDGITVGSDGTPVVHRLIRRL